MVNQSEPSADLAILLVGANRAVTDRLQAAVARAGFDDMRPQFGFVIRALAAGGATLTELAELLGVTKQAAIKVVDDMEAKGYVRREPDPADRRAKRLVLTERGTGVRRAALRESRAMERRLRAQVGDADVDALRRALLAFGDADAARAGRARPVW
jgi:DNA-binding MarR family transcriptional regulator